MTDPQTLQLTTATQPAFSPAAGTLPLQQQFGQMDIYLFDQLLRGNIAPGMRVLDAGCGYGRNLVYLLREGYDVSAVDQDPSTVAEVRALAARLQPGLPKEQILQAPVEALPFADTSFDVVLCSAVLHFARSRPQWDAMVAELWRVLRPGGLLFTRLGTRIGMRFPSLGVGLYEIGDGSAWLLPDEDDLRRCTAAMGGTLVDPIKTTLVPGFRSMTTWVMRKAEGVHGGV